MEKLYLVIREWKNGESTLTLSKKKDLPSYLIEYKNCEVFVYDFNLDKIKNTLDEVEFSITIKQK
jgi:hypothetical protein